MSLVVAGYPGTVDQVQWAKLISFFALHGVNDLSVVPVIGEDRTVRVSFSAAQGSGIYVEQTEPMNVQVPANGSSNPRRDRIILRHNFAANDGLGETTLTSKQGTPSQNPQLPGLTTNPGALYEQHLCAVTVAPGQGAFSPGDISLVGLARSSPVVQVDEDAARPFTRFRAAVIDTTTGRFTYSDGSSYHPLRVRHQDLDRFILRKNGTGFEGNGALGAGNSGPPSGTYSTQSTIGGSWGGGAGSHSSQFRAPQPGLYRAIITARFTRGSSGQTGDALLELRRDMSPSNYTSGVGILSARESVMGHNTMTATGIVSLNTSSLYGVTLRNESSGTIFRQSSGQSVHYSLEYIGPGS